MYDRNSTDSNATTTRKHRPKSRKKYRLSYRQFALCWLISFSVCINYFIFGSLQVANAEITITNCDSGIKTCLPNNQTFKEEIDATWNPIATQYLPYGLGLMALGYMFRKL